MSEWIQHVWDFIKSMAPQPKDWLAVWGATLSTLLATAKGWEMWRDRHRVELEGRYTSSPDVGNEIRIRNLSNKPLIVTYWEVYYRSGYWPFFRTTGIHAAEFDSEDLRLDPNASHTLTFTQEHYFSTSPDRLKGRKVAIRLSLAGRSPIRAIIYK